MCMQKKLLVVDPNMRLTAVEALQHSWLQGFQKHIPHQACMSPTACRQQAVAGNGMQDGTPALALQK